MKNSLLNNKRSLTGSCPTSSRSCTVRPRTQQFGRANFADASCTALTVLAVNIERCRKPWPTYCLSENSRLHKSRHGPDGLHRTGATARQLAGNAQRAALLRKLWPRNARPTAEPRRHVACLCNGLYVRAFAALSALASGQNRKKGQSMSTSLVLHWLEPVLPPKACRVHQSPKTTLHTHHACKHKSRIDVRMKRTVCSLVTCRDATLEWDYVGL